MRQALLSILLLLLTTGFAAAGPFQDFLAATGMDNYAEVLEQWHKAAEQGDANAQYNLGRAYQLGFGVPQDYTEAAKWTKEAAEQGKVAAQLLLGYAYSDGEGVPQDNNKAAKWFRLAAEQGLVAAQFNIGLAYYQGEGVPQDYVLAHMWFNLAAAREGSLGRNAAKNRDMIAKQMTREQIAEAQRMAREWKPSE